MTAKNPVLGVDFGTSNSAVGFTLNGVTRLVPVEAGQDTLPTALFFDSVEKTTLFGRAAQAALIAGEERRYMRALKSLLGTSLMRESRMLLGRRTDFIAIVGSFLAELRSRAEAASGQKFEFALSGRPVMFHSADPDRNAQALVDLRDCYLAAGFTDVRFMPEPEAAALANRDALGPGDLGLIVDVGGGTSDFTLFRQQGEAGIEILRSGGLRIGGTDFDRELSLRQVMPLLGAGSQIRHVFGDDTHEAPAAIFADLATWQKIPFLYTHETRRAAADLAKYATEPERLARLVQVLDDELGHDVAFAVEAGKSASNRIDGSAPPEIRLDVIERGLRVPLPAALLSATLSEMARSIADTALRTVEDAGIKPTELNSLIFVGGSSLMNVVELSLRHNFPKAQVHRRAALTAIVDGLALAAGRPFD